MKKLIFASLLVAASVEYAYAQSSVKYRNMDAYISNGARNAAMYAFPKKIPSTVAQRTLTGGVGATLTFTAAMGGCPLGVAGANKNHYLYISGGTGTAEAVLITGGTCTSGASSGTITFTPANNHSGAWTIESATGGVLEAMNDCPYESTGAVATNYCEVVAPPKLITTYAPIKTSRPGVQLNGRCMYAGPGEEEVWCTTFQAASTNAGPMFEVDPVNAVTGAPTAHVRGIGLNDLTFDATNNPTMSIVIKLRSVSNFPTWSNVTVYGNAGIGLDIGTSAGAGAQISEGLHFTNFYDYGGYKSSGGQYVGSQAAPLVKIVGANEILFHGGKVVWNGTVQDATHPIILVESDGVTAFASAITFDGVSTASNYIHYRVHGSTGVAASPYWVRWENCTLENFNVGIAINDASPPTTHSANLYVSKSTRFFATIGSTPKIINGDWIKWSEFTFDDYNSASFVLGANTIANIIRGPWSRITDSGANIVQDVDLNVGNIFIVQPYQLIQGVTNPYLQVKDTTNSVTASIQALNTVAHIGTFSNHGFNFVANNTIVSEVDTSGNLVHSGATNPYYSMVDTTNSVQTLIQSLDTAGSVGTLSNHSISLVTNNVARFTCDTAGMCTLSGTAFASLGTPAAGTMTYCTNCTIATPCSGAGTGAWAFRTAAGTWNCPF